MTFWKRSRHIGNFKNFKKKLRQDLNDLSTNNGIFWIFVLYFRIRRNHANIQHLQLLSLNVT